MFSHEHLKTLKQGVEAWNKWRKDNPGVIPDLTEVDHSGANLQTAQLIRTKPTDANLSRVRLHLADFRGADL